MEIKSTASFLDKYKGIKPPNDTVRSFVAEILQNTIGVRIKKESVRVIRGVVFVDDSSHVKNKIFLKKNEILYKLKEVLGNKAPSDIK